MAPGDNFYHECMQAYARLAAAAGTASSFDDIEVGTTPKDAIYSRDRLVLYRYKGGDAAQRGRAPAAPILIIYALVNRPYIADLHEKRSLVKGLLEHGSSVYLIDWGYPEPQDRHLDIEHYIDYIDQCVDKVCEDAGVDSVNTLGICQGGTMSLCYAALNPEKTRNLVTMVTPVDFKTPDNVLAHWFREIDAELVVDVVGNVPGMMLNSMFLSLKPFKLGLEKYLDFAKIADQPEKVKNFMRMEKWIFDSPDQAGAMFRTFITDFFHRNALVTGELEIGGRAVDLRSLNHPVLNIYAKQDHLVPPSASQALRGIIGSRDYSEAAYDTGHIGIYVSGKAGNDIPRRIAHWVEQRS